MLKKLIVMLVVTVLMSSYPIAPVMAAELSNSTTKYNVSDMTIIVYDKDGNIKPTPKLAYGSVTLNNGEKFVAYNNANNGWFVFPGNSNMRLSGTSSKDFIYVNGRKNKNDSDFTWTDKIQSKNKKIVGSFGNGIGLQTESVICIMNTSAYSVTISNLEIVIS